MGCTYEEKQHCETTYKKECTEEHKQECETVYKTTYEKKQECATTYKTKTTYEKKQECATTYTEECKPSYNYEKKCTKVPHQSCKYIDVPKYEQVPEEKCHYVNIPKKVPEQKCHYVTIPHCKRCLNNVALRTRFPTVKRSLTKSATKNTRRNATPLTFKSLSKRRSSPVSGLNTDTIMIPPTANLLNNKSANNFNIKNLMETTCEKKWALILQTGWSLSLTFLLGITAVPYSTSTHVSLFIT